MLTRRLAVAVAVAVALAAALLPAGAAVPAGPAMVAVTVTSDADVAALQGFDLAESRHGDEIEMVLWPGDARRLDRLGLRWRVLVPDLAAEDRAIRAEDALQVAGAPRTSYRRLADYEAELQALATKYPGHVRLLKGAHLTHEGRTVYGVMIAARVDEEDGRPTSYVDGLHHAREWPAAEQPMDFATYLAEGYGKDPRVTSLLEDVRVIVVPVVNPDGFHHSREAPFEDGGLSGLVAGGQGAYWRKNRRGVAHVSEARLSVGAYGVDNNRNYSFLWGGGGVVPFVGPASANPIDATYQGTEPFSEPETRNVREWVLGHNVVTMLTNHTHGRLVLWPWGHTRAFPPDISQLRELGDWIAAANGYRGQPGIDLYATTGTTDDWAYAAIGTLGFTMESGTSFHPSYSGTYAEMWELNREAHMRLVEGARNTEYHSIVRGVVRDRDGAPVAARLRLTKEVDTPTSQRSAEGIPNQGPSTVHETASFGMGARADGSFEWHVNPSSRPIAVGTEFYVLTISAPGFESEELPVIVARGEDLDLGVLVLDRS